MRLRKGLTGFVIRRLLLGLVTLWITSVVIFAATQALPGDAARSILGRSATPESLADLRSRLGLDKPILTQYWEWITGIFTGDLGTSLANSVPVTDVIGEPLVYTLFLMLVAGAISVPVGIALGAISARKRDSAFDQTTSVTTLGLAALPEFVVGITLAVIFSTTVFHVLPSVIVTEPGSRPWEYPKELVLPVITLIIAVIPYTTRIMRASTVEILESDFVEMARLKGLSERRVLWRHAVPNALAPTFQVAALNLAYLAGGIVVVEAVFNYPGIGLLLVESVRARDMPDRAGDRPLHRGALRRAEPPGRCRDDSRQPAPEDLLAMTDITVADAVDVELEDSHRGPLRVLFSAAWKQHRTKIGLGITLLLVGIAVFGRLVAPYEPDQGVEGLLPFASPSSDAWLGTDDLGRDVLSRFLYGGLSVLVLSGLATALGMTLGVSIGLLAAYSRGKLDDVLMRTMDVFISLPQIVFALVLAATVGPKLWLLVLAVGFTTMPRAARVARGAAVEVVERDFVRAAEAIGIPRHRIVLSELLPNVSSPLIAETTLRMSFNVAVVAGLSFLGFGLQPPAADWGLMINENQNGLTLQPWPVLLPVIAIALLTIGTSLVGDGLARAAIGIERGRTGGE